jgi:hypothetical protein
MRVARCNVGVLGEVRVQLCVFIMGKELIMIGVCNGCSRRSDISLGEETGLCVRLNSRRMLGRRSCSVAVLRRGRELEIDRMREETRLSVSILTSLIALKDTVTKK